MHWLPSETLQVAAKCSEASGQGAGMPGRGGYTDEHAGPPLSHLPTPLCQGLHIGAHATHP